MFSPDRGDKHLPEAGTQAGAQAECADSQELDRQFNDLVEEIVNELFEKHPIFATFAGVHKYDHELGDFSKGFVSEEAAWARRCIAALEELDPKRLSKDSQIDREILLGMLRDEVMESEVVRRHETDPGTYATAPMVSCYILAVREFAPLEDRVRSMISRMRQIPRVLEQGMSNVDRPCRVFVETALSSAKAGLQFYRTLIPFLANQIPRLAGELMEAGQQAADKTQEYIEFMERILPRSSNQFAVGTDVFNEMLKSLHMVDWDAEYLHAKGKELFDETLEQLEETAARIDPSKSWEEILEAIKVDHPSEEELITHYRDEVQRVKDFVVSQGLVEVPEGEELVVEPTPLFQRATIPYAAYMSPGPFEEEQVGRLWVTAPAPGEPADIREACLRGHCSYGIPTTCAHEAYPGHHLQRMWSNRTESLVRKLSRSTLLIEGWAFYTEELLESAGYLSDPRIRLVRLSDQLWRAARILLDVGLHTGNTGIDEAVDFLVEKVHKERSAALAEVRRYAGSPTQPMSYLMGKLEILALFEDYKSRKGKQFSLKEFHSDLLRQGSIPPAAIRRLIAD